ncbi:hypothetical protein T4D_13552 [Trichinella pseudospiralis]|uniref:Uncharacterized protein n=1 Tax=Trichinella pseudospiralis TaxID=6337 RepID=A0A0V1G616_TRIPS|nr:hypothetical protein T4D_13552 [Trichinella pseudospiralis]
MANKADELIALSNNGSRSICAVKKVNGDKAPTLEERIVDQRDGRAVPSTLEDRPSSARESLASVDRRSSPGAAWHPQQRERRYQACTGRTGLWIATTPARCILHQNTPLERRGSQRPPTDPFRLHSTVTVKNRAVAEMVRAERVEGLHARLRAERRSTTTPITDVRRTVLGAEPRRQNYHYLLPEQDEDRQS